MRIFRFVHLTNYLLYTSRNYTVALPHTKQFRVTGMRRRLPVDQLYIDVDSCYTKNYKVTTTKEPKMETITATQIARHDRLYRGDIMARVMVTFIEGDAVEVRTINSDKGAYPGASRRITYPAVTRFEVLEVKHGNRYIKEA